MCWVFLMLYDKRQFKLARAEFEIDRSTVGFP